jgi:hypothetical protein
MSDGCPDLWLRKLRADQGSMAIRQRSADTVRVPIDLRMAPYSVNDALVAVCERVRVFKLICYLQCLISGFWQIREMELANVSNSMKVSRLILEMVHFLPNFLQIKGIVLDIAVMAFVCEMLKVFRLI